MSDNKQPVTLSFPQKEEAVLAFWQAAKIFQQSLDKPAPKGNFVFFEGPPTANGIPGIHHILARSFKDCLPRYKTMQGYQVRRQAGWDTHGLPVELKVEKDLGLQGKQDIEKYGIAAFNQKCKESVWQFTDQWKKMTTRIAYWLDMENPYITYHNEYIESLWWLIKQIYDQGLLYKGHKVVPHCPRCGTALSSHEVAQGYKVVTDVSLYAKFKLLTSQGPVQAGDFVLAWTTTPWTLPGNVALAVGPQIDYVRLKHQQEFFILAKELVAKVIGEQAEIVAEFKGEALLNLKYQPLFSLPKLLSGGATHTVVPADFVTTEEGTGVVHTAVMYGEDDYNLGLTLDLPKVHTVDEAGKFVADLAPYDLAGKFVKAAKTEATIINYLETNSLLFKQEDHQHDYPFCWRCDTPLLYYAKDSWFIKMSQLREKLVANNQTINWVPEHIKDGRFGEWLTNAKDWAVSRERYWGTPLPIWQCQSCQMMKCVGSTKELGQELEDLHRPFIDEVKLTCTCGGQMTRDKSVLDCWFDSGAMPFAQHHYPFNNQAMIDQGQQFPADYICEAIDQTRGWFYTLLAVSTLLGKGAPYKNAICLGHINDKEGKKMSKSKGNVIDPWQVIEQFGADAVRQHMYTINQPGEGKKYDLDDVRDVFRKNIMLPHNIYKFYATYLDNPKPLVPERPSSTNVLDNWLLNRLDQLNNKISQELDNFHIYEAAREIPIFIDDLSTWYLRRSRDRFKGEDETDKQSALLTTRYVLVELAKLMAPFMPFSAETLWQEATAFNFQDQTRSVHLENWSQAGPVVQKILDQMALVRKVVELGLAARDQAGLKVRQPLAAVLIKGTGSKDLSVDHFNLIADELNVLNWQWMETTDSLTVEFDTELTTELKLAGLKRDIIRLVNALRKEAGLNLSDQTIIYWSGPATLVSQLETLAPEIKKATLSSDFQYQEKLSISPTKSLKFEEETIDLGLATN